MSLIHLSMKSMLSRRFTTLLLVVSISLSTLLLIGVQKITHGAKTSFGRSISGTDLIVGARSGEIQLLLYTVFRQGQPVANMSWKSVTDIQALPNVAWVVPLSLGDSYLGYPVLGTSLDYFTHYQYGRKQPLSFQQGRAFSAPTDVVLGAAVAKVLKHTLGDTLYVSHGMATSGLRRHDHVVFKVVGILQPTGTPVDKTVHMSLEGMTALHKAPSDGMQPQSVTGCLVGLTSTFSLFSMQQQLLRWPNEPLMAIIPGVALSRLWGHIHGIDHAFFMITILVTCISFIGLLLALMMSLQQRKQELAILRIMGARPWQLFALLALESLLITVTGVVLGMGLMQLVRRPLTPLLENKMGLVLQWHTMTPMEWGLIGAMIGCGVLVGFIPAWLAYRRGQSNRFMSP